MHCQILVVFRLVEGVWLGDSNPGRVIILKSQPFSTFGISIGYYQGRIYYIPFVVKARLKIDEAPPTSDWLPSMTLHDPKFGNQHGGVSGQLHLLTTID